LVQFHVESEGSWGKDGNKQIKFGRQVLNVGNGFDWNKQWFLSPYPGTYFFSISGTKNSVTNESRACIVVKLNGKNAGIGEAVSSDFTAYGGFSYQFTIKLNASDKIELFFKLGKMPYSVYFTGWLLDEDLIAI